MSKTPKSENIIFIIAFVFFFVVCVPWIIYDSFFAEDTDSVSTTAEALDYDIGYEKGEYDGYEKGYEYGYDDGESDGYEDGYESGYYFGFEEAISFLSDEVCYLVDDLAIQLESITPDTEEELSAMQAIEEIISDLYEECGK